MMTLTLDPDVVYAILAAIVAITLIVYISRIWLSPKNHVYTHVMPFDRPTEPNTAIPTPDQEWPGQP